MIWKLFDSIDSMVSLPPYNNSALVFYSSVFEKPNLGFTGLRYRCQQNCSLLHAWEENTLLYSFKLLAALCQDEVPILSWWSAGSFMGAHVSWFVVFSSIFNASCSGWVSCKFWLAPVSSPHFSMDSLPSASSFGLVGNTLHVLKSINFMRNVPSVACSWVCWDWIFSYL